MTAYRFVFNGYIIFHCLAILCLFNQSLVDKFYFRLIILSWMLVFLSTLKHQLSVCLLFSPSYYLCSHLPTGNFQMRPQIHYLWNGINLFPAMWQFPEFCLSWEFQVQDCHLVLTPPSHLVSHQLPLFSLYPDCLVYHHHFLKYYKLFSYFLASKFVPTHQEVREVFSCKILWWAPLSFQGRV